MNLTADIVAPMLVNFSTVGFLIIIGLATFVPTIYYMRVNKIGSSVTMVRLYPIRLISRLAKTSSVRCLMILSFFYVLIGLFGLINILVDIEYLLTISLILAIVVLFILLLFIGYISIAAISYEKSELSDIIEYIPKSNKT